MKFNAEKWRENREQRYRMTTDLITSRQIVGYNKQEIYNTLGYQFQSNGFCTNCIAYSIFDPEDYFGIDHDVVVIQFDQNNRVQKVYKHSW